MKKKLYFACLALLCTAVFHAAADDGVNAGLDYFTAEALENAPVAGVREEIAGVLAKCDAVFAGAEKLAAALKSDPQTANAVSKRLEIARRLKDFVAAREKSGSTEQLFTGWQGAKELQVMLEYFEAEQKRYEEKQSAPQPVRFSVKDFGASGNGVQDDGPAFRRAFAAVAALNGKPAVLHVPAGIYRIEPENKALPETMDIVMADTPAMQTRSIPGARARAHLLLTNMKNFTLRGEKGTQLLFTDSTMLGLRLLGGRECVFQNIAINFADNPSTQGTVVDICENPRSMVLAVDPGYPSPAHERFVNAPSRRFTPRRESNHKFYGEGTGRQGKVEQLEDGKVRIYPLPHEINHYAWQNLKIGHRLGLLARYDPIRFDASAIDLRYCGFCRLENVVVHKSPGVSFRLFRNYAVMLNGCRIELPPGSADYVTSNADGCQCSGLIGPYVDNCYFSNMEDDGFNLNSPSVELTDISADRMSSVPFASGGAFLVSGVTGEVKAVLRPQPEGGKYMAPLPENAFSTKNIKKLTNEEKLRLDYFGANAHKFSDRPDRLVLMPSDLSGTVIVNTGFFNIRGLALQITAPNILVENCRISNMTGTGININTMMPWGMLFTPHNIVIRNCRITDNLSTPVSMEYRGIARKTPRPRIIQDIRVENCFVRTAHHSAFDLRNVNGAVFADCDVNLLSRNGKVLSCDNVRNIALDGGVVKIQRPENIIFCKNPADKPYVEEKDVKVEVYKGELRDTDFAPYRIFGSNMVLQQKKPVKISGYAPAGKRLTVEFAGNTRTVTADASGEWTAVFPAMQGGGREYSMVIKDDDGKKIVLDNILIGEVWVCSGQSNMEMPVYNERNEFFRAKDFAGEVKAAFYPQIRFFTVSKRSAHEAQKDLQSRYGWQICSPLTAGGFSACGYFFGRELYRDLNVPVGLISASWGGSSIQPWIDEETVRADDKREYERIVSLKREGGDFSPFHLQMTAMERALAAILKKADAENIAAEWKNPDFDDSGWKKFKNGGSIPADGIYFLRTEFDCTEAMINQKAAVNLGRIPADMVKSAGNNYMEIYLNGREIWRTVLTDPYTFFPNRPGAELPPGTLKKKNVLAVRIISLTGREVFAGKYRPAVTIGSTVIPLENWKINAEKRNIELPRPANFRLFDLSQPSLLFNSMISPLGVCSIRGVIWYQGEANPGNPRYYLWHKMLIDSWRRHWKDAGLPFILVQLAGFEQQRVRNPLPDDYWKKLPPFENGGWPVTREIQAEMPEIFRNVGMAVAMDIGEHSNIHPADKQTVGFRLAKQAEKIAYGMNVACDGPSFDRAEFQQGKAVVYFRNTGSGLVTRDGKKPGAFVLGYKRNGKGRTILTHADAEISGDKVIVTAPGVTDTPHLVRYAFATYRGDVNLMNKEGFPAAPFRSDKRDYASIYSK